MGARISEFDRDAKAPDLVATLRRESAVSLLFIAFARRSQDAADIVSQRVDMRAARAVWCRGRRSPWPRSVS